MPNTNTIAPGKETAPENNNQVDEYTARMDRMLSGLKKKSHAVHNQQLKNTLMWTGIITLFMAAAIYILLNITIEGEPLKFLTP